MAWIIGAANEGEMTEIRDRGFEIDILTNEQEKTLFGGLREPDDTDSMIMVYVDTDASVILREKRFI